MPEREAGRKTKAGQSGRIFNIQHFCLHDGPGIRTTIFLKGCPLRCLWCHNPEGIGREKLLSFNERKCIRCGACVRVCPEVHRIEEGGHVLNRAACSRKGACAGVCATKALEMVGRDITVEELVSEAVKDRYYYNESKGGVTVSGGEPALQAEFLYGLVKALKEEKLHVALETSGFCDNRILESVLPYVDLFLYDCKETDHELHKRYTGVDDTLILENLKWLHDVKARIILRCPVIAGLNDRADHFQGIAALAGEYPNLEGVELLPYHKLGVSKAERMGLARTEIYRQPPQDMADTWNRTVRALGVKMID